MPNSLDGQPCLRTLTGTNCSSVLHNNLDYWSPVGVCKHVELGIFANRVLCNTNHEPFDTNDLRLWAKLNSIKPDFKDLK